MYKENLILIGMPGAGKSTIGPLLASGLGKGYIDTDHIIREKEEKELKDIVSSFGYEAFLRIQEEAILALMLENHVIATGGSVVYSNASMQHLKKTGKVIYLKHSFDDIEQRFESHRKLARSGGQSLRDLYDERTPLYEKNADITVDCSNKNVEMIVSRILSEYENSCS